MIVEPTWLIYPQVSNHLQGFTLHVDVINHYAKRLNEADIITDTHETTHMINADIRNLHSGKGNAFYVGMDRAILLPEPPFRKSIVASKIPTTLRGPRFETYITGQKEWDDRPLYIYDEWCAYTNGGQTAIEEYKGNWTDGVSGCLEFSIYAIAACMCISDTYFIANPDFLIFTKWQLQRSQYIYDKGSLMPLFKWEKQDKLLAQLRNNADMKQYINQKFDSVWL